jgi:hypothetical protein
MKNFNQFTILALAVLCVLVSCSKDSQEATSANYTVSTMQSTYENMVMQSAEYGLYTTASDTFFSHLNGLTPDVTSRAAFQFWVTGRISLTTFRSVTEAMNEFDTVISTYEDLEKRFSTFYNDLTKVAKAEFLVIESKELAARPDPNAITPCQGNCVFYMGVRWDQMEDTYAAQSISNWALTRALARDVYRCEQISIVDDFNDCMNSCR